MPDFAASSELRSRLRPEGAADRDRHARPRRPITDGGNVDRGGILDADFQDVEADRLTRSKRSRVRLEKGEAQMNGACAVSLGRFPGADAETVSLFEPRGKENPGRSSCGPSPPSDVGRPSAPALGRISQGTGTDRNGEGFRAPALCEGGTGPGAGARKPPKEETAGR